MDERGIFEQIQKSFILTALDHMQKPEKKGQIAMYLEKNGIY